MTNAIKNQSKRFTHSMSVSSRDKRPSFPTAMSALDRAASECGITFSLTVFSSALTTNYAWILPQLSWRV